MKFRAILIGNSDGIGLATTQRLLAAGWEIVGLSRSESALKNAAYRHQVVDVTNMIYPALLEKLLQPDPVDLCIYFVGIGEPLNLSDMTGETRIFEANLMGMVKTAALVIPHMIKRGQGHFMGISSLADELLSAEAPSYNASKAGFSNYLGGLALALKRKGVQVTHVRFGFVDTKMAKGASKPLMMSIEKAVDHLEICIRKRPVRYTAPKAMIPLIKLLKIMPAYPTTGK